MRSPLARSFRETSMADNLYADGVTDVVVVGANARIRFHTLVPEEKGQPKMVPAFTVVIPVEALAAFGEKLPELTEALLKTGRLKKVEKAKPTAN
jgi:hypothetical protein